jgi:hypothetical protein
MRRFAVLTLFSTLALPGFALAQYSSAPPDQPAMQPPPYSPDDTQAPPYSLDEGAPPPAPGGKHDHDAAMMQKWQARFEAANTTHDGRLTLQQAQAAGLKPIVAHFSAIDTQNRGYVTFNEIMAWHLDEKAQQMERKAAELREQE